MSRVVMCKGTWPEENYEDFVVCEVKENETDEEAMERAKSYYGVDNEFYIRAS